MQIETPEFDYRGYSFFNKGEESGGIIYDVISPNGEVFEHETNLLFMSKVLIDAEIRRNDPIKTETEHSNYRGYAITEIVRDSNQVSYNTYTPEGEKFEYNIANLSVAKALINAEIDLLSTNYLTS